MVVLKGHETIVTNSKGECYINKTGNPGLASAGTGDVLAGFISSFKAQGLTSYEAACLGSYVHGKIADKITKEKGELFLMASDLIEGFEV